MSKYPLPEQILKRSKLIKIMRILDKIEFYLVQEKCKEKKKQFENITYLIIN
jgi:hypothetical protein